MKFIYLQLLILFIGCTTESTQPPTYEEWKFSSTQPIISAETHSNVGQPAYIHAVDEGLLVYDYQAQTVFNFDESGVVKSQYGQEGDGPGEFRFVAEMWDFENQYMLYDRNGGKLIHLNKNGDLLDESILNMDSFTITMAAVSPQSIYVPTNGTESSLIRFLNLETGENYLFGDPVSNSEDEFDFDRSQQSILNGNIPPTMINRVLLSNNTSGLFVFKQATAILQKYNHSRELEWEIDLKIPATDGIFDRFVEINKSFVDRGMRNMFMLQYASQMKNAENGVFILLNTIPEKPATIVSVSNDGKNIVAAYDDSGADSKPDLLSVSNDGSVIYLGSRMGGEIKKLDWDN